MLNLIIDSILPTAICSKGNSFSMYLLVYISDKMLLILYYPFVRYSSYWTKPEFHHLFCCCFSAHTEITFMSVLYNDFLYFILPPMLNYYTISQWSLWCCNFTPVKYLALKGMKLIKKCIYFQYLSFAHKVLVKGSNWDKKKMHGQTNPYLFPQTAHIVVDIFT